MSAEKTTEKVANPNVDALADTVNNAPKEQKAEEPKKKEETIDDVTHAAWIASKKYQCNSAIRFEDLEKFTIFSSMQLEGMGNFVRKQIEINVENARKLEQMTKTLDEREHQIKDLLAKIENKLVKLKSKKNKTKE